MQTLVVSFDINQSMSKAEESEGYEGEGGCGMGMGSRESLEREGGWRLEGANLLIAESPRNPPPFSSFRLALKIYFRSLPEEKGSAVSIYIKLHYIYSCITHLLKHF